MLVQIEVSIINNLIRFELHLICNIFRIQVRIWRNVDALFRDVASALTRSGKKRPAQRFYLGMPVTST